MTVCEICWTKANERAHMRGGFVSDHYRDLLAEFPNGHDETESTPAATESNDER